MTLSGNVTKKFFFFFFFFSKLKYGRNQPTKFQISTDETPHLQEYQLVVKPADPAIRYSKRQHIQNHQGSEGVGTFQDVDI